MSKRLQPIFTWRTAVLKSKLPSTTKLVALAISVYLNEITQTAWPSAVTLAGDTSLSDRSVREHVHQLEAEGWLVREERSGKTTMLHAQIPPSMTPEAPSGVGVNDIQGTPEAGSPELDKELGRVSQETLPAKAPRKRDPLWDVFTEELYPAVTANERGRRNAALKQIREALSDPAAGFLIAVRDVNDPSELESLWAGELRARIARYRVRFPGVACTETAIASHWSSLAGPNGRPAQPPCPECEMGGGQHAADCSTRVAVSP